MTEVPLASVSTLSSHSASSSPALAPQVMNPVKTPPSDHVYQLILEQFWGDGVSKREIRCAYTTAEDANWACRDYLLRTWPKDHFSMYDEVLGPQGDPTLVKIAAEIQGGDRFNCWVEKQPFKGQLDFSSKAIAKRAGKGPNAYILQRTIKDAQGGKRRSTTRGIFATRQFAKEALAADSPPAEWSSNQGYVLEPGGEYAHALSPSGKTAWLFIEVRPLYMSYTRLDQELQILQQQQQQPALSQPSTSTGILEGSADNPISLDGTEGGTEDAVASTTVNATIVTTAGAAAAAAVAAGAAVGANMSMLQDPFSPLIANPDEAGAYVYLVLQLKTIPFTPPILTVEAVTYELEVANHFGLGILDLFCEPFQNLSVTYEPTLREDGCLQVTIERPDIEDGLTVWVEKRAVVLGDHLVSPVVAAVGVTTATAPLDPSSAVPSLVSSGSAASSPQPYHVTGGYILGGGGPSMDHQLISERASIQYDAASNDTTTKDRTTTASRKRDSSAEASVVEEGAPRPVKAAKLFSDSTPGTEQATVTVDKNRRYLVVRQVSDEKEVLGFFDNLQKAKTFARVKCYASLPASLNDDIDAIDVQEEEEAEIQQRGQEKDTSMTLRWRVRVVANDGTLHDDVGVEDTQPDQQT